MAPERERTYQNVNSIVGAFPSIEKEILDIVSTARTIFRSNRDFEPEQAETFVKIGRRATDFLVRILPVTYNPGLTHLYCRNCSSTAILRLRAPSTCSTTKSSVTLYRGFASMFPTSDNIQVSKSAQREA